MQKKLLLRLTLANRSSLFAHCLKKQGNFDGIFVRFSVNLRLSQSIVTAAMSGVGEGELLIRHVGFNTKQKFIKQGNMEKKNLYQLTDEELLVEKEKLKKSKVFYAVSIGFFAGILVFGFVSWSLSSEKNLGFLIPMLIPVVFIYRMLKKPNTNEDLEGVLKERGLN